MLYVKISMPTKLLENLCPLGPNNILANGQRISSIGVTVQYLQQFLVISGFKKKRNKKTKNSVKIEL